MEKKTLITPQTHLKAVLQALFVTFLWASSTILIKYGLKGGLPALTFAGLRYCIAFINLLILVLLNPYQRSALRTIPCRTWMHLSLLGILFYTITQGAHFIGLSTLPANTLSLIYNFATIIVALTGKFLIHESPSLTQWAGIFLSMLAVGLFFFPFDTNKEQLPGLLIALIGMLSYASSSLLGRHVNLHSNLSPILVTTVSMGVGGILLLSLGGITQGFSLVSPLQWLMIVWLALVNTALAFSIWNKTLRTLRAVEASVINNTILPQVAILAWIFLDEPLTPRQIIAILLMMIAAFIVQLPRFSLKLIDSSDHASD